MFERGRWGEEERGLSTDHLGPSGTSGSDREPLNSGGRTAEVHKQTDLKACGLQVVQDLSTVTWRDVAVSLQLDDHALEADEIGLVGLLKRAALVEDSNARLRAKGNATGFEFDR